MYVLTGDGEEDRAVNRRSAASLRLAGWIWSGAGRPSFDITALGRAALAECRT